MDTKASARSLPDLPKDLTIKKPSKLRNRLIFAQGFIFSAGLALLFYVLYKIGFYTLYDTVSRIGWGFLLIIFLNGARHFLRAWCIYLAVPPAQRTFRYRDAVAVRLGGEAVGFLTVSGPFIGDAAKAALLKKHIPLSQGGAAIIIDDFLYYASVIMLILGGVITISLVYSNSVTMKYVLAGVAICALFAFLGMFLMVWFRIKPLTVSIKQLSKRNLVPNFIFKRKDWINELENNIYQMYLHRRKTFFIVFGLILSAHILSIVEVYTALYLLGFTATFTDSYIIEALTKVINFAFSFVPGGIGVYEGGNGLILKSLGFTTAVGVALAFVRRGSIIFWTFLGLIVLLWRSFSGRIHKLKKHPS